LARLTQQLLFQAPDHLALFYHRDVKHTRNVIELVARRSLNRAINFWRLLLMLPSQALVRVRGEVSLFYNRDLRQVRGLLDLAARRSPSRLRRLAWLMLLGWPRKISGQLSLIYHRDVKHFRGLVDLALRRGMARLRRFLWHLLIGWPRKLRGRPQQDRQIVQDYQQGTPIRLHDEPSKPDADAFAD
jgi:hypothetical protein